MSERCETVVIKCDNDYGQKTINLSDLQPDDVVIDDSAPAAPVAPEPAAPAAPVGKKSK